jgi:CubicO group peptidase (beta-lactamase class C family)
MRLSQKTVNHNLQSRTLIILAVFALISGQLKRPCPASTSTTNYEPALQQQINEDDWKYTTFSAEGLDPTRFEMFKTCIQNERFRQVDGIVVVIGGKILIEEYFNGYDRNELHEIRSATKSIGSALMGIAIDQGYITDVQDKLYAYFQEREPFQNQDVRKDQIELRHILNMTTGLDSNDMDASSEGNETNMLEANDIVEFMLNLPVIYEPGEHWAYSTGSGHLVGAVIENATDTTVQQFAKTYLFEPLSIANYKWKTTGDIAHTGGGFSMLPIDMAKFGQLFLNKGSWHGRRIISEAWVNESSKIHVQVTDDFGYGMLWWKRNFTVDGRQFQAFVAQGNGENHIFIFPDLDLVVVLTGSAFGEIYGPVQVNVMMNKYLLPAVVQDIDAHRDEPAFRTVPKILFTLCAIIIISALIIWPAGFIIRRVRNWFGKSSGDQKTAWFWPAMARMSFIVAILIIPLIIALILADTWLFELFINSGMSHPLAILEVFLGPAISIILAVILWIILLLALVQAVVAIVVVRNKWWTLWQRWYYATVTAAIYCFVAYMFWWGFA